MPELIAGVAGAFIGALASYALGWGQKTRDERRRRKAVATALRIEVYWIAVALKHLRDERSGKLPVVHFPSRVHDQFAEHLEHFNPETVYKVLDFSGSLNDNRQGLELLASSRNTNPESIHDEIVFLCSIALRKAVSADCALSAEGGALPADTTLPSEAATEQFLGEAMKPWELEPEPDADR